MHNYSIQLGWSDEDEGYIATVPEFPYLSAFGETPEEALAEAQTALDLFIESRVERGEPLPSPIKRTPFSGQLRLRMPKTLHQGLSAMAAHDGVSLNTLIVSILSEAVGSRQAKAVEYVQPDATLRSLMASQAAKSSIFCAPDVGNYDIQSTFSLSPTTQRLTSTD